MLDALVFRPYPVRARAMSTLVGTSTTARSRTLLPRIPDIGAPRRLRRRRRQLTGRRRRLKPTRRPCPGPFGDDGLGQLLPGPGVGRRSGALRDDETVPGATPSLSSAGLGNGIRKRPRGRRARRCVERHGLHRDRRRPGIVPGNVPLLQRRRLRAAGDGADFRDQPRQILLR